MGHTVDSEYVMIKKSEVWKNRSVFNNTLSVWLAVLMKQPGANMTEVDELLNQLATEKATLPVRLPVCVLVVNRLCCPLASRGTRTGSRSRGGTGASTGRAGPPCGAPAPVVPEAHLGPWPSEGLSSSQVGLSRCRGTDAQAASCACARVWGRGWRCSRSRLCTLNVGTFPLSPSESAAEL